MSSTIYILISVADYPNHHWNLVHGWATSQTKYVMWLLIHVIIYFNKGPPDIFTLVVALMNHLANISVLFRYSTPQLLLKLLSHSALVRSDQWKNYLWIPNWTQASNLNLRQIDFLVLHRGSGGRFKNTYELLNLRALKFSYVNKIHIFQCMGKIFCVEFQRYPLKFHTKYLTHTLKDMIFMQFWNFKSS